MNNNISEALTIDKQYKKFARAARIVFRLEAVTHDEYLAMMQLMNELPNDAALVLDETHEDL